MNPIEILILFTSLDIIERVKINDETRYESYGQRKSTNFRRE